MKAKTQKVYTPKKWLVWLFVCLLLALIISNFARDYFITIFSGFLSALTPIIIGLILFFILKKLIELIENFLLKSAFKKSKNAFKIKRTISLIIVFVSLSVFFVLLIVSLLPSLVNFINDIIVDINTEKVFINRIATELTQFVEGFSWLKDVDVHEYLMNYIDSFIQSLSTYAPIILQKLLNVLSSTSIFLGYLVIGVTISFLLLKDKEEIAKYLKKTTYTIFETNRAQQIEKVAKDSERTLNNYFVGKTLEALALFVTILPGFLVLNVPYPLVMTLILSLFNFVPYIGSIIALIPIILFTVVFNSLIIALWTIIYVILITTLIGSFISPIIFSKKLKVKSLVVIIAVIFGAGMFGIVGMLFAPPIIAVISVIFSDYLSNKQLKKIANTQSNNENEY